jgi:hypothetical protein
MRTLFCGILAAALAFFQAPPASQPAGAFSLTGRVTTGSGPDARPVRRAKVTKAIAEARTDDLGRYHLHSLPAGDYSVEASTDRSFLQNLFLMPGEKRPDVNQAYYPAGATIDEAKPVRVSAGRDASAVDITFIPAASVNDPAAPPLPRGLFSTTRPPLRRNQTRCG